MEKQQFIDLFVVQFLASYSAVKYEEHCMNGWPEGRLPVEDAETVAEDAWEELQKVRT